MQNDKYTFLLPAFKAKFFEEALNSLKVQKFKEFECIVSDDCSPDDLKSIFDKVVGDDPRFTYRRNEVNMGSKSLVSHWNLLVDMCDTEYLIMASDDDVYEPSFLEEIDKLTKKYAECNIFRGRSCCIDGNGQMKFNEDITEEWMDNVHFIHRIYQKDWAGGIASFVYKSNILKERGMFADFPAAWFSDDVTNFMMADNGCCITQGVTFKVRNSDVQISSQWGNPNDSRKKIIATYLNNKWMDNYMSQYSNYEDKSFFETVTFEYKKKICDNIENYIYSCKAIDFFRFVFQCPNDLGFFKPRMIAHYIRGKL